MSAPGQTRTSRPSCQNVRYQTLPNRADIPATGAACPFSANKRLMHRSKHNPYSITLVGCASSDCGTVRPSVLAVLRLIISSYLVWRLHRHVGGLFALQDAIDITRVSADRIERVRSV